MTTVEGLMLQVLTPAQTLVSAEGVSIVHARLADGGGIGIMPRHAPLIAETVAGDLRYADASGEHTVYLAAGILQVVKDSVTVLTSGPADADEVVTYVSEDETRFTRLAEALLSHREQDSKLGQGAGAAEGNA